MSFNGLGQWICNSTGNPVVSGTTISSTWLNALTADLATGLSTAICKDGQTTVTANIPMGGFKLTGLGTATLAGDAIAYPTAGSWTPVDASGAGLVFTSNTGTYVKLGQLVFITGTLIYPSTVNGGGAAVGGLPVASAAIAHQVIPLALSTGGTVPTLQIVSGVQYISLRTIADAAITNANMSLTQITFSGTYQAAS